MTYSDSRSASLLQENRKKNAQIDRVNFEKKLRNFDISRYFAFELKKYYLGCNNNPIILRADEITVFFDEMHSVLWGAFNLTL